jgi:hypothetical protein
VPYAYKYDLYSRGWAAYRPALERAWTPYLEGREPFEVAIESLVAAL